MKVAANEVERAVLLAQTELEQTKESTSMSALVAAFQRAAQLRDTPLHTAILRGRNDRVAREVKVTTEEKDEGEFKYVRCLIPYTQAEIDGRRRVRSDFRKSRTGEVSAFIPSFYHDQWVRKDRLVRAA